MSAPAQSYSIIFSAFLATSDRIFPGQAVTKSADGTSYVIASTANLAASHSGTVDGVALEVGTPGEAFQVQRDAKIDAGVIPWLGRGVIENAVVDANGNVQRASVAPTGIAIGTVDKEGGVQLDLSGAITPALTVGGDAQGPIATTTVVGLQTRAVSATAPTAGQVLEWSGTAWTPTALPTVPTLAGDAVGAIGANTVVGLQTRPVSATAPTTGFALVWNGSAWAPALISTAPGGSNTQVQYNNAGAFGGAANEVIDANGNLGVMKNIWLAASAPSFNSMTWGLLLDNGANPTAPPASGGFMQAINGELGWLGQGGTYTTIAPPGLGTSTTHKKQVADKVLTIANATSNVGYTTPTHSSDTLAGLRINAFIYRNAGTGDVNNEWRWQEWRFLMGTAIAGAWSTQGSVKLVDIGTAGLATCSVSCSNSSGAINVNISDSGNTNSLTEYWRLWVEEWWFTP